MTNQHNFFSNGFTLQRDNTVHFHAKCFMANIWFYSALLSLTLILSAVSFSAQASNKPYKEFGNIKVYFSAFNSSFIQPDIASAYGITRGKDKGLVNISVIANDKVGGKTALVKGTVANIFAQQQILKFFEVREGNTVYYLAPFEFENEDFMTFKIQVKPDPNKPANSFSFQNKFYHDN